MIVIIGRPLAARTRDAVAPGGLAARIGLAAIAAGSGAELVGSVGDDRLGDAVVVELGRRGVGHAALFRDPGAATPEETEGAVSLERVDARDIALGLSYLPTCSALVIAAELTPDGEAAALEGAAYHGAPVIAIVAPGGSVSEQLAAAGTVLEAPVGGLTAFSQLVGRYAASLDQGGDAAGAFRLAAREGGWEGRGS